MILLEKNIRLNRIYYFNYENNIVNAFIFYYM